MSQIDILPDTKTDEILDQEFQERLWLKVLTPLLTLRSHESDPSDRVQLAYDRMSIAVCERIIRICNSDLKG